jgi:hypothetical protein
MMDILGAYPYLVTVVACLPVLGFLLLRCDSVQRRLALLSGLLATPYGFASVLVVPTYWNPQRVFEFFGAGIEDLIFSFFAGSAAWICASLPWGKGMVVTIRPGYIFKWYVLVNIVGVSTVLAAVRMGIDPMTAILGSFALGIVALLRTCPSRWVLAATAGAAFPVAYALLVRLSFLVVPDFVGQWAPGGSWGGVILGIPAGEIAWAVGFGTCWPLAFGMFAQAKIPHSRPSWIRKAESARAET